MVSRCSSLWFVTLPVSVSESYGIGSACWWAVLKKSVSVVHGHGGSGGQAVKKKKKKGRQKKPPKTTTTKNTHNTMILKHTALTHTHTHTHTVTQTTTTNKHHFEIDAFLNWTLFLSHSEKDFFLKHCCSVSLQCSQAWRCCQWCHRDIELTTQWCK